MNNGTNILSVDEILKRLPDAGVKKRKQLMTKLIKKFGGKPIKHILDFEYINEWDGSFGIESHTLKVFGFSEYTFYNLRTKESGEKYSSISGDFPPDVIIKLLDILKY